MKPEHFENQSVKAWLIGESLLKSRPGLALWEEVGKNAQCRKHGRRQRARDQYAHCSYGPFQKGSLRGNVCLPFSMLSAQSIDWRCRAGSLIGTLRPFQSYFPPRLYINRALPPRPEDSCPSPLLSLTLFLPSWTSASSCYCLSISDWFSVAQRTTLL